MNASSIIKIMVVDDHPVVRFGLVAIFGSQTDMTVVAQAGTGEEAIELYRQYQPDVCLMDLRLPAMSGVEAIRAIRKDFPNSVFIVLTTFRGDEDIHKAMSAGAHSYLFKGMPHNELLAAVRKIHSGSKYLPRPVQESLANRTPGSSSSFSDRSGCVM